MESNNDKILQIVGNETRRKILTTLSEEPRYISEISKRLEVTQPAILKHLNILEKAGLIKSFWKKSPIGAARKYYVICDSVGVEIAINPKVFKVNTQPQKLSCSNFLNTEQISKQLMGEINSTKDAATKAAKAKELISIVDTLLSCAEYNRDQWNCKICHQVASLRKNASQITIDVSIGNKDTGLRKLIDTLDQIATDLQPTHNR